jgi:hypothetical protein
MDCHNPTVSKTSIKLKNENKLYKNYINLIQSYLQNQRKTLWYESDITKYFKTFSDAKKALKNNSGKINI